IACAALAILALTLETLGTIRPPSRPVLVTTNTIEAGTKLEASDVTIVDMPRSLVPDGALEKSADAVGNQLVVGLPKGMVVCEELLATSHFFTNAPRGTQILSVPILSDGHGELISVGDSVALYAPPDEYSTDGRSTLLVNEVRIVGISQTESGGFLNSEQATRTAFIAVPAQHVPTVLGQSSHSALQIVLLGEK
ncbi:MAG: SAF domain-containing protein, partial [Actinomycetaceae bacterium]|nr:SAF domain-containing protein [Actinomycetaceae bacterium]